MKVSNKIKVSVVLLGLSLSVANLYAKAQRAPRNFKTVNYTQYQSNAKVGNEWSPFATPAGSTDNPNSRTIPWIGLKMLCKGASQCGASIYMKTDTSSPVFVGEGVLDMATGNISPAEIINNGFKVTSPEAGVLEIRESN